MERSSSLTTDAWRSFPKRTSHSSTGAASALSAISSNGARPRDSNKTDQGRGIRMDTISRAHDFDIFDGAGGVARTISEPCEDELSRASLGPRYPRIAEFTARHYESWENRSALEGQRDYVMEQVTHGLDQIPLPPLVVSDKAGKQELGEVLRRAIRLYSTDAPRRSVSGRH